MRTTPFYAGTLAALWLIAGCTGPSAPPSQSAATITSGLQRGDDVESWNPIHVAGPNKGTNACPICTYLARPAVVIFARDNDQLAALATDLQNLIDQNQDRQLKGFLIALSSTPQQLQQMADGQHITNIGVCYPDPATRSNDLQLYKINPAATNTIIVYKDYKVAANFVDLSPADFGQVTAAVAGLK